MCVSKGTQSSERRGEDRRGGEVNSLVRGEERRGEGRRGEERGEVNTV